MIAPAPSHLSPPAPHRPTSTAHTSARSSITVPSTCAVKPNDASRHRTTHQQVDPTISWTSSIARHCRNGHLSRATKEFIRMRLAGVEPNHITFLTLLSGCAHFPSQAQSPSLGAAVHALVRKLGLDTENVMVGTALVDMYAKWNLVGFARLCFDVMLVKNAMSWNTMIDGYMSNGRIEDAVTLFDEMPDRDVISWTALIGGFVKRGLYEEALEWFREMQLSGVEPDHVAIIPLITACANMGVLSLGFWVTRYVMGRQLWGNVKLCNSLIDMYSRCGCMGFAQDVFHLMPGHTSVSWNSIINGFASNGYAEEAINYFSRMLEEGFEPDGYSFTGVLSACSHAGLVDNGLKLFDDMQKIHGILPRIEHYGCIVDLYSRSGRLEDALNVVRTMRMKPNEVIIGSVLAACRKCGDVGLAEMLMKFVAELDPDSDLSYVLMANMYAAAGSWDHAGKVRRKMKNKGIQKKPGVSSIEINNGIHEFVASDRSHADAVPIYAMLEILSFELRFYKYVSETNLSELLYYE